MGSDSAGASRCCLLLCCGPETHAFQVSRGRRQGLGVDLGLLAGSPPAGTPRLVLMVRMIKGLRTP